MDYLVFQLYGPFAAWGGVAVGEVRPSDTRPSKSAVLGLVAAALGIRRDQEEDQIKLMNSYGFGVKVDCFGIPLTDYHTVQVPPSTAIKGRRLSSRKDEIGVGDLSTILSYRDYRMDALATVILWARDTAAPVPLERMVNALKEPCFIPYLGRKSCPLGWFMEPQIIEADTIIHALEGAVFSKQGEEMLPRPERSMLYWDSDGNAGVQEDNEFERRDAVISRKRWLFDNRRERYKAL